MNDEEMQTVLGRLVDLCGRIYAHEPHWRVREMVLMPPANPDAIEALSASRPFPFPPAYRAFLRLHDGCLNLWPKFALLGTAGEPHRIVEEELRDAEQYQKGVIESRLGTFDEATIVRFETPDGGKQYLYLPRHTMIGTNRRGAFLTLNETLPSPDGELEVLYYTYDGGVLARYPSFPDFLRAKVTELEERVTTKNYR